VRAVCIRILNLGIWVCSRQSAGAGDARRHLAPNMCGSNTHPNRGSFKQFHTPKTRNTGYNQLSETRYTVVYSLTW
jgi:hypothetical protein